MSNWYSPYHEALLVRLLSLALIFGVLWPVLWMLLSIGFRLARRFIRHIGPNTRPRQGQLS
jgi:hypothetical protein